MRGAPFDRWRRGDKAKREKPTPPAAGPPEQESGSETEPVLQTDSEPERQTVAPEPERARRSEQAFQWEFPEPDRQLLFRPGRRGRHRAEKGRQRSPAEELQARPGAARAEPVPQAEPEEHAQPRRQIDAAPASEARVEEVPLQSRATLPWVRPTMRSEQAPEAAPLLEAALAPEVDSEQPSPEPEPEPEKSSSTTPRAKFGRRAGAERRRRSAKADRVDHEPEAEPAAESIVQEIQAVPEPESVLEAEPEPVPEAPGQEPPAEPELQEPPRPKRRIGFARRDRAKRRPPAEPAVPEVERKPELVLEQPESEPALKEPGPASQEPEPEPAPEPQPLVPLIDEESDFFERAGVGLLVVGMPTSYRDRAAEALGVEPGRVRWLPSATAAEAFLSDGRGSTFVLLLTPRVKRGDAFGMAEYVGRLDPATGMVLLGDRSDEGLLLAAMRAGIREVVEPTAPVSELRQALERVIDGSARIRSTRGTGLLEPAQGGGSIISLFSSKGGIGKTFIAANLAAALAAQSRVDTAVLDLDLTMGDAVSYFGAEAPLDAEGFARLAERSDRVPMRRAGLQVGDHLWAYAAKPDSVSSNGLPGEAVAKVLRALQRTFGYIVVDTAPAYNEQSLAALDLADVICLVNALDVVSVRHLSSAFNTLMSLGIAPARFLVVLNRADSKVKLSVSDVERVLRFRADALIPSSRLVPLSLNKGRPVYLDAPKSSVSKSIGALAERIGRLYPHVAELPDLEFAAGRPRRSLFRKR